MKIIGISCFYHDSAAALVINGNIISAVQEERFTRVKHDASFPIHSIKYCLNSANLKISDIDAFVFYEKPFIKFERLLETYLQKVPFGFQSFKLAIPLWIKEKLFQRQLILIVRITNIFIIALFPSLLTGYFQQMKIRKL